MAVVEGVTRGLARDAGECSAVAEGRAVWGLAWIGVAAACAWLYRETFPALARIWEIDPNYSHGWLVPVAFLVFAWRAWARHGLPLAERTSLGDVAAGTFRIALGLAVHAGCLLLGMLLLDVFGLILVLSGAMLLSGGRAGYRPYAFATAFLIFMAPLPAAWYQVLAIQMQQIASAVSAWVFELCAVPVYRQGCYVRLPGYEMEVGAACSGLRQLAAIVALSLAIGHLSGRGLAYKWTLGLLSVPIAITANCIRVTLTGFILLWFGREWAEGVYHTLEGLAIVGVAAGLILLVAWALGTLADGSAGKEQQEGQSDGAAKQQTKTETTHHSPLTTLHTTRGLSWKPRVALLVTLMAAGVVGQQALARHLAAVSDWPVVPLARPLAELPTTLGDWHGEDTPIEEKHAYADEHLQRRYWHSGRNQTLSVWAVYSGHGEDRAHHPEVCMAVAGMPEDTSVRQTFAVPGHEQPVQQYRFGTTGRWQWVFYWHYTLPPQEEEELDGLQRFYRGMHHRPSSVTLEVFVPENSPEDVEAARDFVRQLDAAMQAHLPPGAVRGSRRVPVTVVPE